MTPGNSATTVDRIARWLQQARHHLHRTCLVGTALAAGLAVPSLSALAQNGPMLQPPDVPVMAQAPTPDARRTNQVAPQHAPGPRHPQAPPHLHLPPQPHTGQPHTGQPHTGQPVAPQQLGSPAQPVICGDGSSDPRVCSLPRSEDRIEIVHHRSQLLITRDRVRRIAVTDPSIVEIVQYTETELSILGVGLGATDLTLWFEGSNDPLIYTAEVIRDPSLAERRRIDFGKIERRLALLYPNSKVFLIPMASKVIVRGQVRDSKEASNILQIIRGEILSQDRSLYGAIGAGGALGSAGVGGLGGVGLNGVGLNNGNNVGSLLDNFIVDELVVPGEFQVQLRIRIAELSRSQARNYGLDFAALIDDGRHVVASTVGNVAPVLSGIVENGEAQVFLEALATNGYAKILADSSVVVISGESASFLSGGEFAVPTTVGIGGAAAATTSFRGFGTSIIAQPEVLDYDLIRMTVIPELSSINQANAVGGIPGVDVRRVQTRVQMREGQTLVLGGLFSRRQGSQVTRIPFLGELPIVGPYVFSRKTATEDENELLIVVTPEIIRPMEADEVPPLPGFYVTHPDDHDLYKYNRTEGNPDLGYYQLMPYGNGNGYGMDVGYSFFNPQPGAGQLPPQPQYQQPQYQQPQSQQPQYQQPQYQAPQPQPQPTHFQQPHYITPPPACPLPTVPSAAATSTALNVVATPAIGEVRVVEPTRIELPIPRVTAVPAR